MTRPVVSGTGRAEEGLGAAGQAGGLARRGLFRAVAGTSAAVEAGAGGAQRGEAPPGPASGLRARASLEPFKERGSCVDPVKSCPPDSPARLCSCCRRRSSGWLARGRPVVVARVCDPGVIGRMVGKFLALTFQHNLSDCVPVGWRAESLAATVFIWSYRPHSRASLRQRGARRIAR